MRSAPEAIDVPQRLQASKLGMLVPRALAYWIDTMALIGFFLAAGKLTGLNDGQRNDAASAACLAACFAYFIVCEWRWGRTLGKRIIGLQVVNREGGPISFGQSLGRNLVRLFDASAGPFLLLGAAVILLTENSQRLGDLAAQTFVVPTSLLGPVRRVS